MWNPDSPSPSIHHFSHPHPLELQVSNSNQAVAKVCSGCKFEASIFNMFYACKLCNYILHIICSEFPQCVTHPADPKHTLTLLPVPAYPGGFFYCDACGRPGNGFSYHCPACRIDIHILCLLMPLSINHQSHHHHPLTLTFSLPYKGRKSSSCDICQQMGPDRWLYRCRLCDFHAHLTCMRTKLVRPLQAQTQTQPIQKTAIPPAGPGQCSVRPVQGKAFLGTLLQSFATGEALQLGRNLAQDIMGGGGSCSGGGGGGGRGGTGKGEANDLSGDFSADYGDTDGGYADVSGQYSPSFLVDQLDSHIFRKMRYIFKNPGEMGLGDITLISFPFLQVLQRLEMSLTTLRDAEFQKLGDIAKQKFLEHRALFKDLGHILEQIASCVSDSTIPFSQSPLQGHERDETLDVINSIYDNLVALSSISLKLETIEQLIKFATSSEMAQMGELEMAGRPYKDPLLPVHTCHVTVQSKINYESFSEVTNTSEVCKSYHNLPLHLKRCIIYTCILFLGDYEFEEDTLIQLWIAGGFLQMEQETGRTYFKELHRLSIFQISSFVCENYESTYIVHKDIYELIKQCCPYEYAIMEEGGPSNISSVTLHSTLFLGDKACNFNVKIFERFYEAELLRTLKLQNECGSPIKYISHNLFVKLRFLRVLDLNSTKIKELPPSVCNLRHLRYLDVSGTPIKKLPELVSELYKLETLKLRGCLDLVGLPKGTSKLIKLQHLDLDGVHQLTSMPPRMGQLTNLKKLSIFVVGRQEGFRIEELKYMKKLRGSLCIAKMENVTKDQGNDEAQLGDKDAIHTLEFQWSSSHSKSETEFNLIEPHHSIEQLKITRYGAESFPNWLSSEKFYRLTEIHLRNCNCSHLPDLGKLPSLKSLYIHEMYSLKEISHEFYGAFLKLEVLEIDGMPYLEKWTAINEYNMPSLHELTIIDCPKLVTLPEFMNLKSLQHLRITLCPKIQSFPGERLPKSLQSLTITECPKLEEQCRKEKGKEYCKIAGIPEVWIEYQQIPQTETNEQPTDTVNEN